MKTGTKLREERTALRELKEKVEALLRERKYAKVVEEIGAFSKGYTRGGNDVEWAELQVRLAFAQEKLGRYDRHTAEAAYEILKLTDRRKEIGAIERILGREYLALGETKTALRYLRNSLTEFDTIGNNKGKLETLNALGRACFMTGRIKEAIEHLTEALDLCHQNKGDKGQEAMVRGNLGTVYRRVGDWTLASDMLRKSLNLYEQIGDRLEIVKGLIALARLLIMQRNFDEAERLLQRAEGLNQLYPRERAMVWESLGDLAVERGELEKAEGYYQRTLEIGRKIAPRGDLINQVQRRRAELLIAEGKDLAQASECIQEALRVSQSLGDKFEEGCCYRTMGRLVQAKGDSKAAEANFEKAVEVLRSLEDRFELANTLLAQGELTRKVELLRGAQRLFSQIQGVEFYQALALLQIAKVEPSFKKAIETLGEAEKLLQAKGETEKLKEVENLKVELNQRLKRFPSRKYEFLQGLPSDDLGKVFGQVIEVVGADRGFVAYAVDGDKKMMVGASHNLGEGEVKGLLSLLADRDGFEVGSPFILYDSSLDERFSSTGAYSIMVTPLGSRERIDGYLYVDRQRGKEPFLEKELDLFYLLSERVAKAIAEQRQRELERQLAVLKKESDILTRSPEMLKVLEMLKLVQDSEAPVLLMGETGTGKDFLARKIHQGSARRDADFIEVHCGAIPKELAESELFGHERGAFTGAVSRKLGRVELAEGGTLFLNEVGELPESTQVKLLRFLDSNEFERVGGNKTLKVDTRIIAATNRDLKTAMERGTFRRDLYYRLNVFCIELPPLRARKEDILLLAHHFMKLYGDKYEKEVQGIAPQILRALMEYDWPGNIRELENAIETMVIATRDGEEIGAEFLPKQIMETGPKGNDIQSSPRVKQTLKEMEKRLIRETLRRTNGSKYEASKLLGIGKSTLYRKVKEYGLN